MYWHEKRDALARHLFEVQIINPTSDLYLLLYHRDTEKKIRRENFLRVRFPLLALVKELILRHSPV